jgi:hypothetical protein
MVLNRKTTGRRRLLKRKTRRGCGQKGGIRIGEGAEGSVFSPPLKCKEGDDSRFSSGLYVSKQVSAETGVAEHQNSFLVRNLDPTGEWSIVAEHVCSIAPEQINTNFVLVADSGDVRNYQLIFKNGGLSLLNLLMKDHGAVYDEKYLYDPENYDKLDPEGLRIIISVVKKVVQHLDILNSKYSHNDMHLGNIVYNRANDTGHIIDFARMTDHQLIMKDRMKFWRQTFNEAGVKPEKIQSVLGEFHPLIVDSVYKTDMVQLFSSVRAILDSDWAKSLENAFKYKSWLSKYGRRTTLLTFRNDYKAALLELPRD